MNEEEIEKGKIIKLDIYPSSLYCSGCALTKELVEKIRYEHTLGTIVKSICDYEKTLIMWHFLDGNFENWTCIRHLKAASPFEIMKFKYEKQK